MANFSGDKRYAVYDNFKIGTDCDKFKLVSVGKYSGNAGNTVLCVWTVQRSNMWKKFKYIT